MLHEAIHMPVRQQTNIPQQELHKSVMLLSLKVTTGMETVEPVKSLIAWMQNDRLYVSELIPEETWKVLSITGVLAYQNIAESDKADISLPARGVYIVQSGENTIKTKN